MKILSILFVFVVSAWAFACHADPTAYFKIEDTEGNPLEEMRVDAQRELVLEAGNSHDVTDGVAFEGYGSEGLNRGIVKYRFIFPNGDRYEEEAIFNWTGSIYELDKFVYRWQRNGVWTDDIEQDAADHDGNITVSVRDILGSQGGKGQFEGAPDLDTTYNKTRLTVWDDDHLQYTYSNAQKDTYTEKGIEDLGLVHQFPKGRF